MKLSDKIRKKEINPFLRWFTYVFLLAAIIMMVFSMFLQNNIEQVREQNQIYLNNTALQTASRIDDILRNTESSVAAIAQLYSSTMKSSEPDLDILQDIAEDSMCDYVEYANSSGLNLSTGVDVSDREYYQKGISGKSGVDVIYNSRVSHSTLVVFYAPLVYENETVGVLLAGYHEERMSEILEENYFGESSVSYLCESDGTVIARSAIAEDVENVLDFFTEERVNGEERDSFLSALDTRTSCVFSVEGNEGETDVCLTPLDNTDWCIVQTYPSSVTAQRIDELNRVAIAALLCLALGFGGYILLIAVIEGRRRKRLLQEKQEVESVVEGINRLFARFVVVNLETNSYYYLKDYSNSPSRLDRKGVYTDFVAYFQEKIIETAGDTRLEDVLEPDYFREHMDPDTPYLRYHFCLRRDTGIHWESGAFICLSRDAAGVPVGILFAIQDITELHKQDEEKNQALKDAFRAAEAANHAKDDFLSRMSHDMRTPMNAVMGMTDIAAAHIDDPERVKDCLYKIHTSGQHLLSLINEMLDLSKIESGQIHCTEQPFHLHQCVRETLDFLRPQIAAKHLQLKFPGNSVRHMDVLGDEHLFRRILMNVLENAVEYTPDGGSISLSMSEETSSASSSACYTFVCEDTGIGMSEELLNQIFEPFVSAEDSRLRQGQGIGLGLTIARQFAQLMGGDITAQSTPGKGSRFTIRIQLKILPEDKEPSTGGAALTKQDVETEPARFEGRRILLVEDNEMNAEIAVELLAMLGIETDTAANGKIAVELLKNTQKCPYDLILMDIQMPVMNGYEATKQIRASGRADLAEVPIVALTAYTFRDDIDRALASGMNAHLAKPVSAQDLAKMLEKWCG